MLTYLLLWWGKSIFLKYNKKVWQMFKYQCWQCISQFFTLFAYNTITLPSGAISNGSTIPYEYLNQKWPISSLSSCSLQKITKNENFVSTVKYEDLQKLMQLKWWLWSLLIYTSYWNPFLYPFDFNMVSFFDLLAGIVVNCRKL